MAELEAGLDHIRQSPRGQGVLELIVRRPGENEREVLDEGVLDLDAGLVGDAWRPHTDDRYNQVNVMNARAARLVAGEPERQALAGDQLYIDFDLSDDNAPPGTRLAIGAAIIEITAPPHTGCKKFEARFGADARAFVNSPEGKRLHLRGVNARIVRGGVIRPGDVVLKVVVSETAGI
jgi:hypothetical protein